MARTALPVFVKFAELEAGDLICVEPGDPWAMVVSVERLALGDEVLRPQPDGPPKRYGWGDLLVYFRTPGDAGGWSMYRHPDEMVTLDLGSRLQETW